MRNGKFLDVSDLEHQETFDAMASADVIYGYRKDHLNEEPALFYGREALKRIMDAGRSERLSVLRFALDFSTDELELLYAAVKTLKGTCDYNGHGIYPEEEN